MREGTSIPVIVGLLLFALDGCGKPGTPPNASGSNVDSAIQTKLRLVIERYIKADHPDWSDVLQLPATVKDAGDEWEYSFTLRGFAALRHRLDSAARSPTIATTLTAYKGSH